MKYIVPVAKMDRLRSMIQPFVTLDKFCEGRPHNNYTVRSIYFDDSRFRFYEEKEIGQAHRLKVRLRGYNTEALDNVVFLEIKRKYEIPIMKNRAPSTFGEMREVFDGSKKIDDVLQDSAKFPEAVDNGKRFFYQIYSKQLRPVVLVIYEREAYLGALDSTIRITFDKNLRGSPYPPIDDLYNEKRIKHSLTDQFILEVKFNDYYPAWMKSIVGALGLHKESASKYCMCIDAQGLVGDKATPYKVLSQNRLFNIDYLKGKKKYV